LFIDDLDRCKPEYVVELLEGILTIFYDVPVTYLVAADREWVSESFQEIYKDLSPTLGYPGRPLGYLFAEKIFAVAAPLVPPNPLAWERYWRSVLEGQSHGEVPVSVMRDAEIRLGASNATAAIDAVASLEESDGSVEARALREVAAVKVAEAATTGEFDHVLQEFLPLTDHNPRSLKRLRNGYAVNLISGLVSGVAISSGGIAQDGLIRWTIITLRWPRLANYLIVNPETVQSLSDGATLELPDELAPLAKDPDVKRVMAGDVAGKPSTFAEWWRSQYMDAGNNPDAGAPPPPSPDSSLTDPAGAPRL
jgi:hypothetical protein